jgi:hypothetical protein
VQKPLFAGAGMKRDISITLAGEKVSSSARARTSRRRRSLFLPRLVFRASRMNGMRVKTKQSSPHGFLSAPAAILKAMLWLPPWLHISPFGPGDESHVWLLSAAMFCVHARS